MNTSLRNTPVPACLSSLDYCVDTSWGNDESDSVLVRVRGALWQVFLASQDDTVRCDCCCDDGQPCDECGGTGRVPDTEPQYAAYTLVPVPDPDDPTDLDWSSAACAELETESELAAWVAQ